MGACVGRRRNVRRETFSARVSAAHRKAARLYTELALICMQTGDVERVSNHLRRAEAHLAASSGAARPPGASGGESP
jgi:hypothetical protein